MKISPAIRKTTGVMPEREHRHEAERVVDRAADVAVGGAEEGARAEDPLQTRVLRPALRQTRRNATAGAALSAAA